MLDPVELFPEVSNLYEFPSVHADMIFDERRVNSYKQAIDSTVKKGDVVIDIGTGTGLLSFLSLQAGAARVHAIERAPVIRLAKLLAEKNRFADRIIFHHSDARDVHIDEKADVIVSELIGHMAFEEGMAETLYGCKQRFLKSSGALIPTEVNLNAALVCEKEIYPEYINGWQEHWGIDYSVMRDQAIRNVYITDIAERDLLSKSQKIFSVDFSKPGTGVVRKSCTFTALRSGSVNGAALWFDAQLTPIIKLSSSPWTKTHWRQCFAPFEDHINVSAGQKLKVLFELSFRSSKQNIFVFNVKPLGGAAKCLE